MGRRPNEDLLEFRTWLIDTLYMGDRTATVYTSRVRKMLKEVRQPISPTSLTDFLKSAGAARSRDGYVTGWNHFRAFCNTKNVKVPAPSVPGGQRASKALYQIPGEICDHILDILALSRMHMSTLVAMRWHHIRRSPNQGRWMIEDPVEPNAFYYIPIVSTMAIFEWGHPPEPEEMSPFIPIQVGSLTAMPLKPLRRLLARHKRNQLSVV